MNTHNQNEATEANLNENDIENNINPESEKIEYTHRNNLFCPNWI